MSKFIIKSLFVLIPILSITSYYNWVVSPNISGDLSVLGEIPFGKEYDKYLDQFNLSKNHTIEFDGKIQKKYDVVTIGDSFSQQGIKGYQNYLGSTIDKDILNIKISAQYPEITAVEFINAGILDKIGTKALIIESVERHFIYALKDLDFKDNHIDLNRLNKWGGGIDHRPLLQRTASWIRLSLNYQNSVKCLDLSSSMFNLKNYSNKLYFYADDLSFSQLTDKDLNLAKVNLYRLNDLCIRHGIKLAYLLAADKYDVYQTQVVNNPYPQNNTLNKMKLDSISFIVNSKTILTPYVTEGKKDIYKVNDSHWSQITHKIIADNLTDIVR